MKITGKQLQQLIKEEWDAAVREKMDNEDRVAEFKQEILSVEATDDDVQLAQRFIEHFHYTTTAIVAMELALMRHIGDDEAGNIVSTIIDRLAQHEAETI